MKKTTCFCDRCGEELVINTGHVLMPQAASNKYADVPIDLCAKCTNGLRDWWVQNDQLMSKEALGEFVINTVIRGGSLRFYHKAARDVKHNISVMMYAFDGLPAQKHLEQVWTLMDGLISAINLAEHEPGK